MSLIAVSNNKLNVTDYEKWTQEDWQEFVKLDDNEKDANVVLREGFQRKLMEEGVFGGNEFFKRVPAHFSDECGDNFYQLDQPPTMQYPITRVLPEPSLPSTRVFLNLYPDIPPREDLIFTWGDQTFRLEFRGHENIMYWKILEPFVIQHGEQCLAYMPDMFLQIKEIASIEKTANKAKEVLDQLLIPSPLIRLIIGEYYGESRVPSQAMQQSAERMKDIRLTLFATFRPRALVTKNLFADPLRRELAKQSERVSSMVVQYVGETDVVKEESAPAKA